MMTVQLCKEPVYKIQTGRTTRKPLPVGKEVWNWLGETAVNHNLLFCLGHTLDGVFWGRMIGDELHIALTEHNRVIKFDQKKFFDLLSELRLFGKTTELHLWRQNGAWQANLIQDGAGDACEYIDETQMLWGTHTEKVDKHFTLMSDGVQELYHAAPLPNDDIPVAENGRHRPLRLQVRHYLADDEMGRVRIAYSRLVDVTAVAQEAQNDA